LDYEDGEWEHSIIELCDDCSERNPDWTNFFAGKTQTFGVDEYGVYAYIYSDDTH
jgi:hypothetical protein